MNLGMEAMHSEILLMTARVIFLIFVQVNIEWVDHTPCCYLELKCIGNMLPGIGLTQLLDI